MNDDTKKAMAAEPVAAGAEIAPAAKPIAISFAEFLEGVPPSQEKKVSDVLRVKITSTGSTWYEINAPQLTLHCPNDPCNGPRFFRFTGEKVNLSVGVQEKLTYLEFVCSNCRRTRKIYSLHVSRRGEESDFIDRRSLLQIRRGSCIWLADAEPFAETV